MRATAASGQWSMALEALAQSNHPMRGDTGKSPQLSRTPSAELRSETWGSSESRVVERVYTKPAGRIGQRLCPVSDLCMLGA